MIHHTEIILGSKRATDFKKQNGNHSSWKGLKVSILDKTNQDLTSG
jgi:hypothetical protein